MAPSYNRCSYKEKGPYGESMVARILLADDFEIVRRGIRALLEGSAGWEICGEAANGQEAVEKTRELRPDVVVLDVSMPIMNGIEAAREIHNFAPATKIVIFSVHSSAQFIEQAKEAGAHACLTKDAAAKELHNTIAALL
jgi:two-component system nitrate/nitrite response regulator NarL